MSAVTFSAVAKRFGSVQAVAGLDLDIKAGSTLALLGPNGAGKSTSIGMLLGQVRPDTGGVTVFGGTPDAAVAAGRVGAMLQEGALIPGVTVREIVDFVRRRYPRPMPLAQVLDLADLTGLAGRRADRLSGGQAQRVRFALAVAGAPDLLVLDEPTTGMDVESRRAFWAGMRAYAAEGHTILFATHYLEEADENAERVVVVARGAVIADGSPAAIKTRAGGRGVRFTLGDQSAAGLDRLPGVTAVEIRGAVAELRTDEVDDTLHGLYASGLRVRDLELLGAGLEDAFLALTGDHAA